MSKAATSTQTKERRTPSRGTPRLASPVADTRSRILIFASNGDDATRARAILESAELASFICNDLAQLISEVDKGVGAILVTEDALDAPSRVALAKVVVDQPVWSDLPIFVLTLPAKGEDAADDELLQLGNVTLLERPARVATVVTALRSALRARERQYAQSEKLQAQALLAAIVESSDDAIISKTLDGTILSWNAGAQRLFGYSSDEAIGKSISLIVPEDRLDEEMMILERLRRGERIDHYETVRVTKYGKLLEISLTISPIRDSANRVVAASKVARDITQRREVERALLEADRRKDEFLATLAHELRNPLAPIRNSLHILRVTATADPALDRVREILDRQVNHMVRLVDDLLEVSRITRGKIELRTERIELAAVIGSAVETSKPLIDAGGQELIITIPPYQVVLEADPVRLAQVFANLLNNAAKYSERGQKIWLSARAVEGQVAISVRDAGIGIAPDILPRVFDMFVQADSAVPRAQGGLGIGLTLVRSLVEMHGGTVEARSEGLGRGTEFVVTLPLAKDEPFAATPRRTGEYPKPLVKQRVLVVDDNHDAADSLGMMLTFLGADVHVAYDSMAALAALGSFQPHVALLDLSIDGMDGYELARRIRSQEAFRHMTLIALSGWGAESDRVQSREAGYDFHLIKPPDVDALQALMASLREGERPRAGKAAVPGEARS